MVLIPGEKKRHGIRDHESVKNKTLCKETIDNRSIGKRIALSYCAGGLGMTEESVAKFGREKWTRGSEVAAKDTESFLAGML